jgi:hypothetical protein
MASNDSVAVWTPGIAIHFGSLDFVVNNKGEMTKAPKALVPLTTDCWGPSAYEGPQKQDLTVFLEHNVRTGTFGLESESQ